MAFWPTLSDSSPLSCFPGLTLVTLNRRLSSQEKKPNMGAFTSTSRSLLLLQLFISTSNALLPALPTVTQRPSLLERRSNEIQQRAISTELSTCGYLNGDPGKERTADPGFNCRIDTRNGIWGFCPTSVIVATDCGLAGSCVDKYECAEGCGITDKKDLTTFTW